MTKSFTNSSGMKLARTSPFQGEETLPRKYHKHPRTGWHPRPVSLASGKTPPNAWGLYPPPSQGGGRGRVHPHPEP